MACINRGGGRAEKFEDQVQDLIITAVELQKG